jgi:hypothetical protein
VGLVEPEPCQTRPNKSLIVHSAWNIANNKNLFMSAIIKAKYYPNDSFWTAPNTASMSIYWSSAMHVKHHLVANTTCQIHAGNSSLWSSPWMPVVILPLPAKVSDLWFPGTRNWNHQLLSSTFTEEVVQLIEATPVVTSERDDILRWIPTKNGLCTTKYVYNFLAKQQVHHLPTHGLRSISHDANLILQKVWKSKTIPPLLKTFVWQLIRRAIATGERAGRYSTHIDQHYSYYGIIENDQHLFFQCNLPATIWL